MRSESQPVDIATPEKAEAKCPNCGEKERFFYCNRTLNYFKLEAMPNGQEPSLGDMVEILLDDEYRGHMWCEACDKCFQLDGYEIECP